MGPFPTFHHFTPLERHDTPRRGLVKHENVGGLSAGLARCGLGHRPGGPLDPRSPGVGAPPEAGLSGSGPPYRPHRYRGRRPALNARIAPACGSPRMTRRRSSVAKRPKGELGAPVLPPRPSATTSRSLETATGQKVPAPPGQRNQRAGGSKVTSPRSGWSVGSRRRRAKKRSRWLSRSSSPRTSR